MPQSMRTAIISLLPKPGKDHLDVNIYRPLSLLNIHLTYIVCKDISKKIRKNCVHFNPPGSSCFYPRAIIIQHYEETHANHASCQLHIQWWQYHWMWRKHLTALIGSRMEINITGVSVGGHDFKLNVCRWHYKINWSKSEPISLNQSTYITDLGPTPFIWKWEGMKYLGIKTRIKCSNFGKFHKGRP